MPTVIYVDVLLFINAILTYAVLTTAERLFKRETRLLRLTAASLIGSLFSLLIFLDVRSFFFSLLIKVVSSLTITLIAFPFISRKEYGKTTLGTVGVSVVYSGFFILLYQLFRPPNMAIVNDIVYFEFNPLVMLGCTALIYIGITAFHKLFRERIKNTVVKLHFKVGSAEYRCLGKVDTGCSLTEPFSGAPVIVADSALIEIADDAPKRVIPYSAVGGSSILYAVKADQVTIDGKPIDKTVYIAVTDLRDDTVQAVINSDIIR